jgi:hypothetical protein
MVANAEAQLPPAPTPQATRAALLNPNWCSDVPASPPPPNFELRSGNWASFRQMCMNLSFDMGCVYTCGYAEDLWRLQKSGKLNQPNTFPSPTDQPQGPFPQPGGSKGYILPAQPAPVPSGPTSDAADSTSALSAVLAPGPFSSYFGQDLSATTKGQGQPPDVSADVSPKENAEFINYLGLWVWNKPTLPVPQPAPTPTLQMSNNDFWCKLPGVSGQRLPGCDVNGNELLGLLADTQIGYDATLGRWTATQLAANGTYAPATITSALENGSTANITTKTNPYGLVVGDIVTIAGVSVAGYNGNFAVTAIPSPGSIFQYMTVSGLGAGTGGTALLPSVATITSASDTNCPRVILERSEESRILPSPSLSGKGRASGADDGQNSKISFRQLPRRLYGRSGLPQCGRVRTRIQTSGIRPQTLASFESRVPRASPHPPS